jgi:4-hydroxythreonine-4-phosphate dehydrogenase
MPISKSNNNRRGLKPVGITMGDPGGIGPEIIAKALRRRALRGQGPFCLIGDRAVFEQYVDWLPPGATLLHRDGPLGVNYRIGRPDPVNGAAALMFLDAAIDLLRQGQLRALVTAPLAKETVKPFHRRFQGHTEYLAEAFGNPPVGMLFVSGRLKIIIVTRHLPIRQVPRAVSREAVLETIRLTDRALRKLFHIRSPEIGVCGLNPHAGEGGTIGREEITAIIPAIEQARLKKINVRGPFAADTLFAPESGRHYDAIVAMYHDQGLIPAKAPGFNRLVNLTIGLPFIRTSPAHGTAFDIAGQDRADPSSMAAAITLADGLSA